ncbi:MAG: YabP/YqfC family sporulation protein [Blautia caecimuris]
MFFQQKRKQLREGCLTALEVPRDLACRETVVTLTGCSQAVIENYRSILKLTEEEIIVSTFSGKLTIMGKKSGNSLVYHGRDDSYRKNLPDHSGTVGGSYGKNPLFSERICGSSYLWRTDRTFF